MSNQHKEEFVLGINFESIKNDLRSTDIGKKIDFFNSNTLPTPNQVSEGSMAWIEGGILYCDLSGYTSMTNKLPKKTVARLLISFHSSMVRATNQCQGKVINFAGDRVMSVFMGANKEIVINHAIECALGMQTITRSIIPEELQQRNFNIPEISCTIGLDYGRVLMGRFGAGQSTDVVLVGDAANIAAKLQTKANPNETFVLDHVYQKFPSWITKNYWEKSPISVPNIGQMVAWKSDSKLTII